MAGLGWLVTRRGFRPVLEMAQVAEGISAQQLDERLNPATLPVELQSLANAFNGMLDRLGDSLQRLSAFSSDLAHELRTPVNNLMTQTQVCLSKLRNHEEYREVLYSNLEEFERLGRMIGDMLFLAKADHGLVIPGRQLVDIRSEIEALFEFYDALAADKQLVLVIEGEGQVPGDALMLRRAFSNLLSNAIRHADAQSAIQISLESLPHYLMVTVGNRGDTISTEHLPRLFDRFYRADASRQRQDEGVGLGLAITRSIVLAHGGEVDVTSQSRETRFRISLPTTTITRSRAGAAIANNRPEWESGGGEAS
jgi:two-component system heavy metal sensor histidine kinase CusS